MWNLENSIKLFHETRCCYKNEGKKISYCSEEYPAFRQGECQFDVGVIEEKSVKNNEEKNKGTKGIPFDSYIVTDGNHSSSYYINVGFVYYWVWKGKRYH